MAANLVDAAESSSSTRHEYHIGGIKVQFPYKAYGPQLAFMGRVIANLHNAFRDSDSQCNALLESPTGSGKSLSLLCASLAWQQHRKNALLNPEAGPATQCGGGFIPEESTQDAEDTKKLLARKLKAPTIYYATRTHTQISQIVQELRKTAYRVPMAILAAKKHYCTNKNVCKKPNMDEECNLLIKDPNKGCPQLKNVHRLKCHSSLQHGGSQEVHDIEDLVKIARRVRACPYFASREMAQTAGIVFCPYSYILNPAIRKAMGIDVRGSIVIFDEAHNIEDMARDAGSVDLTVSQLEELRLELATLCLDESGVDAYYPLSEVVEGLLMWIHETSLNKLEANHFFKSWTGESAAGVLQSFGISVQSFPVLLECAVKATGSASDPDPDRRGLTGRAATALEGLFSSLRFMLLKTEYVNDYQLAIRKVAHIDRVTNAEEWVLSVCFWCLNPGVVFNEIATACKSVILTSGTLSPMGSFASELGVSFEIRVEAPHVIDVNKQVCVNTVAVGPRNVPLNAAFANASSVDFQDALGTALEDIYKVVPGGALVFFPSYALMDRLCYRWKATGLWNRFLVLKEVFVEPRGKAENFEHILDSYYKAVAGKTPVKRRGTMMTKQNGAAFFAVCRGKVSEGINFSDENARVVIVIGIPFTSVKDMQVQLKKQYNNTYRIPKNLLGGDQWYCQEAFRALNQAIGRCIRHRHDYGAILLMDERFNIPSYVEYMSKWVRRSIKMPLRFEEAIADLKRFFEEKSSGPPYTSTPATAPAYQSTPCTPVPAYQSTPCTPPALAAYQSTPPAYPSCFETLFRTNANVCSPWGKENASCTSPANGSIRVVDGQSSEIKTPSPCQPWRKENLPEDLRSLSSTPRGKENISVDSFCHGLATPRACGLKVEDFTQSLPEDVREDDFVVSDTQQVPVTQKAQNKHTDAGSQLISGQVQPDTSTESELLLCDKCGHELGPSAGCVHHELQKTHLTSLVMNTLVVPGFSVSVAMTDAILSGLVLNNSKASSVWVEEDGCVFKHVNCRSCKAVIGARIVATDPENMQLAGKIVLLKDLMKTKTQPQVKRYSASTCIARGKLKLRKLN